MTAIDCVARPAASSKVKVGGRGSTPSRTVAIAASASGPSASSSSSSRGGGRKSRVVALSPSRALATISAPLTAEPTAGAADVGVVPSLRELRQAIPKECFEPDAKESLKYAAYDLAALAACFGVLSPVVVDHPWLLPIYAPVTGTVMWMNFVIGHDCGHGSFSKSNLLNAVVGHITHSPLLVPFWPWAYSHKQHHRFHNHETKDMSHPWMAPDRYEETNPIVRFLALDHPWGVFLGFPGYLLLEPEWSSTDGSHFLPQSRLFDRAPKDERAKCAASTAACVGFLAASFAYLAPYLCFSWWLFTVTYLQHHDYDTKTYPEGEWEYVLGGLETIDREFGWGVDSLTHHITDCHVAHHMFSDMPHYRLEAATEGVRGVLEPRGLYKKRDTRDFAAKVFQVHKDVGHCIEPDRPRATAQEIKECLGLNDSCD